MRFMSSDSLSPFRAGDLNSYAYALNDPVNYSDPTGHWRLFTQTKVFSGDARPVNRGHIYLAKHPQRKGEKAITAVYHGDRGYLTGHRGAITPDAFVRSVTKKAGLPVDKYDLHVIACYTADPLEGRPSFIESVARLTGRRVYGYSGTVSTSEKESPPASNGDVYYRTLIRTELAFWARNKKEFNYRPVSVETAQTIRDSVVSASGRVI
ncbi:hypothetical protein E6B08_02085 [Pseudomonas putida]|uniref:RHS repeat-associated core domain-containing protein n=2 Tax=Pseudomonas putida TaxID=303 RepID=A0A4D6XN60_PSEPU|nr:hypothetical protein E6B08_02085 [Pseudomonas putida]